MLIWAVFSSSFFLSSYNVQAADCKKPGMTPAEVITAEENKVLTGIEFAPVVMVVLIRV